MTIESGVTGSAPEESAASTAPAAETADTQNTEQAAAAPVDKGAVNLPPLPQATVANTPPAYTPNFKYKAALQEKEVEEFWRPLMKDAESEKKVKDMFTKSDAFDFMKTRRDQAEQQIQSMNGDLQSITGTVQRFNESVKNNDLSSAFRQANISKEQIFQWTQRELQKMDMPADQRQQMEQYEQAQSQKYDLEQQVSFLQKQYESQATQARVMQLDQVLSRPDVSKFAEAWDQNSGQEGAFKNFVIEEAQKVYLTSQQDITADQAVKHVMQRFGKFLNAGETAQAPPQVAPQQQAFNNKPVIPNVMGKAASPIKKVAKNLDDLKKLAKEARASESN